MKKSIGALSATLFLTILTFTSCDKDQNEPKALDPVISQPTLAGVQKSNSVEFDFVNQEVLYNGTDYITIAHEVDYSVHDEDYWVHVTSMSGDSYITFFDSETDHVTFEMYDEEFTMHGKFSVARADLAIFDVVDLPTGIWGDFVECLQDEYGSNWQNHLQNYAQNPASLPNDVFLTISECFLGAVAALLLNA